MTNTEIEKFGILLVTQAKLKPELVDSSTGFWTPELLKIDFVKAEEAIKAILMEGATPREPGRMIGAVIRHCGGKKEAPVATPRQDYHLNATLCQLCRDSGCIDVPHQNDWVDGRWNGRYSMVVACECGMGKMRACYSMNIAQYEASFPYWRDEYPLRQYEKQFRDMSSRPIPFDAEDADKHRGRISWLKKQLGEVA